VAARTRLVLNFFEPAGQSDFSPVDITADIPDNEAWLEMAENEVETLRMAAAILRLSKPELIERFGENPDALLTLAEEQFALVERNLKRSLMLVKTAAGRILVAGEGRESSRMPRCLRELRFRLSGQPARFLRNGWRKHRDENG